VRGTCAYPHMSQNVNNLYYKKIRAPPPSMIVRKQYVMSREMFEFGPLLVGKDKEEYKTKYEVTFFFFFTLVAGPRRFLSLTDTRVYEP